MPIDKSSARLLDKAFDDAAELQVKADKALVLAESLNERYLAADHRSSMAISAADNAYVAAVNLSSTIADADSSFAETGMLPSEAYILAYEKACTASEAKEAASE